MQTTPARLLLSQEFLAKTAAGIAQPPVVDINNATFYRQHPSNQGNKIKHPPIFPGLRFSIPSSPSNREYWAVIGPSNAGKTTFLEVLRGQHVCIPPGARTYPYPSPSEVKPKDYRLRSPLRALQYVGFNGSGGGVGSAGLRGAYMSARYESRKEQTDYSVRDYLTGHTELNPTQKPNTDDISHDDLEQVVHNLNLRNLIDMPVGNLSNGQSRRARIAKALLGKPELLLLDEPFMGLDPATQASLSPLLFSLAQASSPRLLLALRPQDSIPDWITHLVYLNPGCRVGAQGRKDGVLNTLQKRALKPLSVGASTRTVETGRNTHGNNKVPADTAVYTEDRVSYNKLTQTQVSLSGPGEPVVQMKDVIIKYGEKLILGGWAENHDGEPRVGLHWTVRKGERWGVFGPNGSGKTTLMSLICSDHPLAYSLPIKMFGYGRLPLPGRPGISIFDIQARIGQSSPEVHAFFPRNLTLRQTIENAWAETFLGTPKLNSHEDIIIVDNVLQWFESELNPHHSFSASKEATRITPPRGGTQWADKTYFRDISFSSQRVALFLRAIVKKPELIVLDEAFSGMDEAVRDRCMRFLAWGNAPYDCNTSSHGKRDTSIKATPRANIDGLTASQALICISHVKEEVTDVVREWMCLPEAGDGKPARFGRLDKPLQGDENGWKQIWGV